MSRILGNAAAARLHSVHEILSHVLNVRRIRVVDEHVALIVDHLVHHIAFAVVFGVLRLLGLNVCPLGQGLGVVAFSAALHMGACAARL